MTDACVLGGCVRPLTHLRHLVLCSMHGRRLERVGSVHRLRPEDYFFHHVTQVEDGCWLYSPVHPDTGYAQFTVDGTRRVLAHRWSYEFFVGPIPEGLEIDHLCSNCACVNPAHLEPVTHRVNAQRGVGSREECVNGHPYDASNTEIHVRGHRQCRTCRLARERRVAATA